MQTENHQDIKFADTTYENIIEIIENALSEFDLEMKEILEDYITLCEEHNLTNIDKHTLLVFTAGKSLEYNFKYSIYHDPATRNHSKPFKYIGLYANKTVVGIGELKKIVCCDYDNGELAATQDSNLNDLSKEEYQRIKNTIENTKTYDLRKGEKFFLVENFYKTDFKKISPSPIQSKKYFSLNEFEEFKENMSAKQVADILNGKTWR